MGAISLCVFFFFKMSVKYQFQFGINGKIKQEIPLKQYWFKDLYV